MQKNLENVYFFLFTWLVNQHTSKSLQKWMIKWMNWWLTGRIFILRLFKLMACYGHCGTRTTLSVVIGLELRSCWKTWRQIHRISEPLRTGISWECSWCHLSLRSHCCCFLKPFPFCIFKYIRSEGRLLHQSGMESECLVTHKQLTYMSHTLCTVIFIIVLQRG